MGVAEGGVGEQQFPLLAGPLGELLRAEFAQFVASALGQRLLGVVVGQNARQAHVGPGPALDLGIAVDDHVAQVGQQAGGAQLAQVKLEQLGTVVDEAGAGLAADEVGGGDDVVEEGNVGFDSADAELVEGAFHALEGERESWREGGDLDQHGVVEGRNHRSGVAHGPVEADAQAGGGAVGDDFAVVRGEVGLGILGRDAALDGEAVAGDFILGGNGDGLAVEGFALGDEDLGTDKIDAGDHLRHRVLDLDARVHLDEEPLMRVHIDEEFHGAGVLVTDLAAEPGGGVAEFANDARVEVDGGGDLDHFLVAALDGAVALVQVDDVAMFVA